MQNEIYFGFDLISKDDLQHYGIPKRSGRYPWGSGENPYHHGESAPGGKKTEKRESLSISERIKRRKAVRDSVKKAKADAKASEARAERERLKNEALASGDPKKLAPFVNDLSDTELKNAAERLKLQNDFADKMATATKYQKSTADKINSAVEKMTTYANTGMNAWNAYAKLHNAFRDPTDKDSKELPVIGSTTRASIREAELKKIEDAYDKQRKRRIEDEGREAKRAKERMDLAKQRLELEEKRVQIEQLKNGGGQQQISDGGGKKKQKRNNTAGDDDYVDVTEKTPEEKEADLRKKWADEANAIANRAKSEARKDFRRTMAEDFSKQLREDHDEELRKKWSAESDARSKEARDRYLEDPNNRKEARKAYSEDYSRKLKEEHEKELREKWTREANQIVEDAKAYVKEEARKEAERKATDLQNRKVMEPKLQEKWKNEARRAMEVSLMKRDDYDGRLDPVISDINGYNDDYEVDYADSPINLTNTQWRNLVSSAGKNLKKRKRK